MAHLRAGVYARVSKDNQKALGRSVDQQEVEGRRVCDDQGWVVADVYRELNGISASRFAKHDRPDWTRLVADIDAGRLDVLVIWESSRGSRDLEDWAALLRRCRDQRVLIHVVSHNHTYDMQNGRDWRTLAEDGVDSAYESEKTSARILRDKAAAAQAGRPDGRFPFGYQRRYDPATRALIAQEPHPEQAPIVRDIFARIASGDPISAVAADLGLTRSRVRRIATNPVYVARRHLNGVDHAGSWAPLVDEPTFWAAQRVLSDPARKTTRPGRVRHLLSYLATCAVCDQPLAVRRVRKLSIYVCPKTHVGIREDWLDQFVTALIVARLSRPDVYPALTTSSDAEVIAARGEADQLRQRLDEAADAFTNGDISGAMLAKIEARLVPQIKAAAERATLASTPPVLRSLLDPEVDVQQRWDALGVAARKECVRLLIASIRVRPTTMGRASTYAAISDQRVEIVWHDSV